MSGRRKFYGEKVPFSFTSTQYSTTALLFSFAHSRLNFKGPSLFI